MFARADPIRLGSICHTAVTFMSSHTHTHPLTAQSCTPASLQETECAHASVVVVAFLSSQIKL